MIFQGVFDNVQFKYLTYAYEYIVGVLRTHCCTKKTSTGIDKKMKEEDICL